MARPDGDGGESNPIRLVAGTHEVSGSIDVGELERLFLPLTQWTVT
ncbi:MAG: hypothetical protein R3C10_15390 [Pirellulales bacterium]